ncbi:hypothetical protein CKAH01_04592 [Colletotrichum kahawae]|uniref:Uncharacterized protein n=1 Tax=Colletotrichum kahawae TaxID=34407 RepID=A0AAE0D8L4_COLKA|nr:hypothetical protein CKAH01_04592 [Colletotrichum kahawae]
MRVVVFVCGRSGVSVSVAATRIAFFCILLHWHSAYRHVRYFVTEEPLRPDDILAWLLENEEHVPPRGLSRLPTSGRTGRRGTLRRRADFRLRLREWLAKASSSASVSNFAKCLAP